MPLAEEALCTPWEWGRLLAANGVCVVGRNGRLTFLHGGGGPRRVLCEGRGLGVLTIDPFVVGL
jgi:hypothetical protein